MVTIAITTSSFDLDNLPEPLSGCEVVLNPHGRRLTENELSSLLTDEVVGLVAGVEPVTAAVIEASPSLVAIARVGTGIDNVDLEAAERLGIEVSSTPEAPTTSVAELTVGLILDALRGISAGDRSVRTGGWQRPAGRLLAARTVGVVGAGRIGAEVARLLDVFGCRVVVHDPYMPVPDGAEAASLGELLAVSDVVTLHVPLTDETRGIIDSEALSLMPAGSVLINTARGGLVDEDALDAALDDGRLAAAALDAFADEPYSGPLTRHDRVVLTPHMGASAAETRARMEREAATNLAAALTRAGIL